MTETTTGSQLLAKAIKSAGVDTVFFLMGGPMTDVERELARVHNVRLIDVRHEQGAAMMAHAYSRLSGKPGVCMTGAGVDAINLTTGLATAFVDCSPIVAICGSSNTGMRGMGAFQEMNQLDIMKPITKASWQVPAAERIPHFVDKAFRHASSGKPGPVYLEIPSNVLDQELKPVDFAVPQYRLPNERPVGDSNLVAKVGKLLAKSERPLVLVGSGALWSKASSELRSFVEATNIPFYTTPQARGIIPEDHPLCFLGARSLALREADCVLVIGTRANFIFGHFLPPRFAIDAKVIEVNIDADDIGDNRRADVGIVGDARTVLQQLIEETSSRFDPMRTQGWLERLKHADADRRLSILPLLESEQKPIHILRLCKEIREMLPRDAVLAVDGHETLTFARQSIPTHCPGHRLNVGPAGCIGVGVPFGIGAKVARPDKMVVVFSGDGGFGMNGMEMDTAIRHNIPIVVVVNNNGGWGTGLASPSVIGPELGVIGRDLGFTRYDKVVEALGGWGEFVEEPSGIRPAFERAIASGKPALVNVITDPTTMATSAEFTDMMPTINAEDIPASMNKLD